MKKKSRLTADTSATIQLPATIKLRCWNCGNSCAVALPLDFTTAMELCFNCEHCLSDNSLDLNLVRARLGIPPVQRP